MDAKLDTEGWLCCEQYDLTMAGRAFEFFFPQKQAWLIIQGHWSLPAPVICDRI